MIPGIASAAFGLKHRLIPPISWDEYQAFFFFDILSAASYGLRLRLQHSGSRLRRETNESGSNRSLVVRRDLWMIMGLAESRLATYGLTPWFLERSLDILGIAIGFLIHYR